MAESKLGLTLRVAWLAGSQWSSCVAWIRLGRVVELLRGFDTGSARSCEGSVRLGSMVVVVLVSGEVAELRGVG